MKIIQVNASYKPAHIYGGPTMSVSKLSEVLVSKGVDLEVITTNANGPAELEVSHGKTVFVENVPVTYYKRITRDHTHFSPGLLWGLHKKLNAALPATHNLQRPTSNPQPSTHNPELTIVHIHAWWNLVSVLSCIIAVLQKGPVVVSPRGTLSSYSFGNSNNLVKKLIHRFISKPLLRHCHFHATSENEKTELLRLVNPKSITVIPNLVTLADTAAVVNAVSPGEPFKLLFFSRIEQKKGLKILFSALHSIDFNYILTIAGPGEEAYINSLKKLSASLGINNKILWTGPQLPEKKFDIMAQHDLLVLPSHNENFANVVIESLASGTAVAITENVGLSDYVMENNLGWVCKFDAEDLRGILIQAASDPDKLKSIRQHSPAKIRADFSDDKISERYIDMYKKILQDV